MATLKDLKPGDHVLVSRDTYISGLAYTDYYEDTVSCITDSGFIDVDGSKYDPITGLELNASRRHHIALPDDEQALKTKEEVVRKKRIDDVVCRMHSCHEWNLNYEQAISIAMIMGWKV